NTKTYDGNATASATPALTSGTLASGDTATYTETYDSKHAGTGKTLTPAVAIVDGNSANMLGNYNVTLVSDTTGVIGTKAITVTAVTNTKPYDGNTSASATPRIDPALVGGDTSGFVETYDTPDPGTGKTLTPSGSANDGNSGNNYTVTFVND